MNGPAGGWQRLGRLGSFDGAGPWSASHTALPFLLPHMEGPAAPDRSAGDAETGAWLFATARDAGGRSSIGRADVSLAPEPRVVPGTAHQVLAPGALGTFDDRGVTMSCLVIQGGVQWLYYTGWMLGVTVPFYLGIGLAVSDDNGRTFRRVSRAPVLERTDAEPFLTASPCVLVEEGLWRMWYVTGTAWEMANGQPRHRYHIRYAESSDGVQWRRQGRPCIDYATAAEYAFGRPCVRREDGQYRMWYSSRGDRYVIGYAESPDGISWTRYDDHRGLAPAREGWDSEMTAYPWVFDWRSRQYMLYNGNDYGRTGVGIAVWQDDASAPWS